MKAAAAFKSPAGSMQGALMLNGKVGSSSSAGEGNPGVLHHRRSRRGHEAQSRWAAGVEDVSYAATSGRIYSLTEYPGGARRVRRSRLHARVLARTIAA